MRALAVFILSAIACAGCSTRGERDCITIHYQMIKPGADDSVEAYNSVVAACRDIYRPDAEQQPATREDGD